MLLVVLLAAYGYVTVSQYQAAHPQETQQNTQMANPASTNCVNLGGSLEIREVAGGQAGYCHMSDGRVCEEWALFRDGSCVSQ